MRILPLSLSLLVAAIGTPRLFPKASPRLVVRIGVLLMLAGILVLMSGIDLGASASVVSVPMLLIGLGIGALASQLGAVAVSAVPDDQSAEVGGLQNTATNLGASLGTALAGSVLIGVLTTSFLSGISANPAVPENIKTQATVQLAPGVPFLSDTQLNTALTDAGASPELTTAVMEQNDASRVEGLDAALAVLAVLAVVSLFFTGRIPSTPVGAASNPSTSGDSPQIRPRPPPRLSLALRPRVH